MKQKITTIACVILLALQLNALVKAEEDRASGRASADFGGSNLVIGSGVLEEASENAAFLADKDVSDGDVSDGDISGGDVSDGDAETEDPSDSDPEDGSAGGEEPAEDDGNAEASDRPEDADRPEATDNGMSADETEEKPADGEASEKVIGGSTEGVDGTSADLYPSVLNTEVMEPVDIHSLSVVQLQVPRNLNFVMDPLELYDQGSVWSQEYVFCNKGDAPIKLSLKNIKYFLREDVTGADAQVSAETVAAASGKMIRLQLVMSNGDVVDITEEGSSYDVVVGAGEEFVIEVSGTVSNPEENLWQTGDASISITYSAEVCGEPES